MLYVGGAFAFLQAADIVVPAVGLPPATLTVAVWACIVGLPIAIVLSWAFDLTPEGLTRTPEQDSVAGDDSRFMTRRSWAGFGSLILAGLFFWQMFPAVALMGAEDPRSIAVLPFENMSLDDANQPFTDGIHDDILTQLSKIEALRVVSRTTVREYRQTDKTVSRIADELGVAVVLEGGVQRVGDQLRINVQLIEGRSDQQLWAQTFDRTLTVANIFEIQSEIAAEIASSLRAELTPVEETRIAELPTEMLDAYDMYLRGNGAYNRSFSEADLQAAVEALEAAVDLDPGFALAHAKLSQALTATYFLHYERTPARLEAARASAERALELNPTLPEAHAAMGYFHYWGTMDAGEARRHFDQAGSDEADLLGFFGSAQRPIPLQTSTLDNGLQLIVSEDPASPVVTVSAWFRTGSRVDPPGREGMAHLFEHLLFGRTENLPEGNQLGLVQGYGAEVNGTTDYDAGMSYVTAPASHLALALWLMRERMDGLLLTPEEVRTQIDVISSERSQVASNPLHPLSEVLSQFSPAWEPYRHSTMGEPDRLAETSAQELESFYATYFAPNNLTLVIAGDVRSGEATELVERYLGDLTPSDIPELPGRPRIPRTDGPRRATVDLPGVPTPYIAIGFTAPSPEHPDTPALQLLATILGGGESSRLHRDLVVDDQIANAAAFTYQPRQVESGMIAFAMGSPGADAAAIEGALVQALDRFKDEGATRLELRKAKNAFRASQVIDTESTQSRAETIQRYALLYGDAERLNTAVEQAMVVDLDDLRRVARKYLSAENRFVIEGVPGGGS